MHKFTHTNVKDMKNKARFYSVAAMVLIMALTMNASAKCVDLLNFEAKKLRSQEKVNLCDLHAGKTVLVVNTASQCGFTPQFKKLEALHQENRASLAIIGIPSDDFNQEYDDAEKIAEVCYKNFGVSFTMLETMSVKGDSANGLHKALAQRTGTEPSWNFNKYLISSDGERVKHLPSSVIGEELVAEIEAIEGSNR